MWTELHRIRAEAERGSPLYNAFLGPVGPLQVDPDNRLTRVRMQHWMYLAGDRRTLVNRVVIRKFGIRIAEVTEYFQRGAVAVPGIASSDPGRHPPGR